MMKLFNVKLTTLKSKLYAIVFASFVVRVVAFLALPNSPSSVAPDELTYSIYAQLASEFSLKELFSSIFNQKIIEDEQNSFFNFLRLNRKKGLEGLKKIFQTHSYLKDAMNSEHQVFFSSLSKKKKINSILEIGTYDGKNAFLLSKLFPKSLITTVDLPDESKEFK